MQNLSIVGNVVRKFELKDHLGENDTSKINFTLAVKRSRSRSGQVDFIPFSAFNIVAVNLSKYANYPGAKLAINFEMESYSYTDSDGTKHYGVQNNVKSVEFLSSKPKPEQPMKQEENANNTDSSEQTFEASNFPPTFDTGEYDIVGEMN